MISSVVYPSGHNDAIYEDYAEIPSNCKCVVFSTRTDKGDDFYVKGSIDMAIDKIPILDDICYIPVERSSIIRTGFYVSASDGSVAGTGSYYQIFYFLNPNFKYVKMGGYGSTIVFAIAFYSSDSTFNSSTLISGVAYPSGYQDNRYEAFAQVPANCKAILISTRNDKGDDFYVKGSIDTLDIKDSDNEVLVVDVAEGGSNTQNLTGTSVLAAGTTVKVVINSKATPATLNDIRFFNSANSANNVKVVANVGDVAYVTLPMEVNRIYCDQNIVNVAYTVYKVKEPQELFKNELTLPINYINRHKVFSKKDLLFKNQYWYSDSSHDYGPIGHLQYIATQIFVNDVKTLKINFTNNSASKTYQYSITQYFGGNNNLGSGWQTSSTFECSVQRAEYVIIMIRVNPLENMSLKNLEDIDFSIELFSGLEQIKSKTDNVKEHNDDTRNFKISHFDFGKQIGHLFINEAFSSASQTIPCQSLFDVDAQSRMGFKVIHSNCQKTATSGKYVMCHGSGGKLGTQFEGLNGADPTTTVIASSTFSYLRENFVYKSLYSRYKVPISELEEWLQQVKRCNAIPCVQYVDEEQVRIIEKYFPTNYILYGGNRSVTKSWIYSYEPNITAGNGLAYLSRAIGSAGLPLIIAIQHADRFTDEELLSMAKFTHEQGAYIGIAGCYESLNQIERCYRAGFDFNIAGWDVNQFEDGNIDTLMDFEDFETNGTVLSDGTLKLEEGQTISFTCSEKSFINKAGVKIMYNGSLTISMGKCNGTNVANDGKQTSWFSSFFINSYPTFTFTADSETIISHIKFVASKC